jgi:hypothetical protein
VSSPSAAVSVPQPEVGPAARLLHRALSSGLTAGRYLDRYYRDAFDRTVRPPLVSLTQTMINGRRPRERLGLAEERPLVGEEQATQEIVAAMSAFVRATYAHSTAERAGNTKTYGIVRGRFEVLSDLPAVVRHGVLAQPRTYPAWVRFAGPGPLSPPDMQDNGILSMGIKLMDVPGRKLLDDERHTQDFTGISAPTFTTPNVIENAKLQRHLRAGVPAFHFIDPRDSHLLDAVMQGLYARAHHSPLEVSYWSCVPYLLGDGRAMKYRVSPSSDARTPIPACPRANYLRDAMSHTLAQTEVQFDFSVQLQTDPHRMPIENASVIWPERLSPMIPVARLTLPLQRFTSPAQLAFARNLSFQPWHSVEAHRPLGNQNRARRTIYLALSRLRQELNDVPHIEPRGDDECPWSTPLRESSMS